MVNPCSPALRESLMHAIETVILSLTSPPFHFRCFSLISLPGTCYVQILWVLLLRGTIMEEDPSVVCVASSIIWPSWARLMLFFYDVFTG
jgi:hypothetical protein